MDFLRALSSILTAAILLTFTPPAEAAVSPFPDMEGSWYRYREAVAFLSARGIVGGYPDGTFQPKKTINRAELLKIIFAKNNPPPPPSVRTGSGSSSTARRRRCFSDVNPDAWYASYVCAAKNRGIVKGYDNGTFQPDQPVNYAEAIKIILNAYGHDVPEGIGKEWFKPFAEQLDHLGILPEHAYIPWLPLNRERAADLLWRMLRYDEDRVLPGLSPGCGKVPLSDAPTKVTVDGVQRDFLLTVPRAYVPHDPVPLIIAFHGRTNSNEQVRSYMGLDRAVTDAIIAYPAAIKSDTGVFRWSAPGDKPGHVHDVLFFDALVESLADAYCIDMDRISVVGHSLGAWMANSVACIRGDVVFASATVGGDSIITPCSGPTAAMIIHNPRDTLASFSGAEKVREMRTKENACTPDTVDSGPAELNCIRHSNCSGGNDVLWCPHTQDTDRHGAFYPHQWPDGTAQFIAQFLQSLGIGSSRDALRVTESEPQ